LTTSCDSVVPNESSSNGRLSAGATRTSAPGTRAAHAEANCDEGSTAATLSGPRSPASTPVSGPGPQPTSSAVPPARSPIRSIVSSASARP
jgi:hypothetical protein